MSGDVVNLTASVYSDSITFDRVMSGLLRNNFMVRLPETDYHFSMAIETIVSRSQIRMITPELFYPQTRNTRNSATPCLPVTVK